MREDRFPPPVFITKAIFFELSTSTICGDPPLTLFIFLLHVWLFIKPSLYCYENFYCKIFGFIFIISLLIANYIVLVYLLPIFFSFFLNFENANYISYQGRISEYLLFIYNLN